MAVRGRKPDVNRDRTRGPGDRKPPPPPGTVVAIRQPHGLSPGAAAAWKALVPSLAGSGALVPGDHVLLIEMVETLALAQQYRQAIREGNERGTSVEYTRSGTPYTVPYLGSAEDKRLRTAYVQVMGVVERLASEYGMTPTARARIGVSRRGAETLLDVVQAAMEAEGA
jgi:phage terminase small subunit